MGSLLRVFASPSTNSSASSHPVWAGPGDTAFPLFKSSCVSARVETGTSKVNWGVQVGLLSLYFFICKSTEVIRPSQYPGDEMTEWEAPAGSLLVDPLLLSSRFSEGLDAPAFTCRSLQELPQWPRATHLQSPQPSRETHISD